MHNILTEIISAKRAQLEKRKKEFPLSRLNEMTVPLPPRRDFRAAIARRDRTNIIAEIKKASPSAGIIAPVFEPAKIAKEYTEGGAAAISVLTEENYFKGSLGYLQLVRKESGLPLLRKDFLFEPYQIHESLAAGADAVLLIAALLELSSLRDLLALGRSLGLDCLVEVHTREELETALSADAGIIGINNRDLTTFKVDLSTSRELCAAIPGDRIAVIESGITGAGHLRMFREKGVNAFLIGERLMRDGDVKTTLKEFVHNG